jgi:hypothetical protein
MFQAWIGHKTSSSEPPCHFRMGTLSDIQAPSFPTFLAFTLAYRALCARRSFSAQLPRAFAYLESESPSPVFLILPETSRTVHVVLLRRDVAVA